MRGSEEGGTRPPHPEGARYPSLGAEGTIMVLRPGLLTTVQDRGRFGYQKFGVPVSGAVDGIALRVANLLVRNPEGAAGLEITALGPQLRFLADAVAALTGAEVNVDLDGAPVPWYQSFLVRAGQTLDVQTCTRGLRSYLAVAGGIDVPVLLGSRSTCLAAVFGGFQGRALAAGDVLRGGSPSGPLTDLARRDVPEAWRLREESPGTLRVVLGPQDDAFTKDGLRSFLESTYLVTHHADRMGCRLDGPEIAHRESADIISDWVPLGGVQVPGDRKPIILLADRQTTGGYPKIATVIGSDLPLVAQCRPGDRLRFQAVSVAEAQAIAREFETALRALAPRPVHGESWIYAAELGEVPGEIAVGSSDFTAPAIPPQGALGGPIPVRSPLQAAVLKLLVSPGEIVTAGQPLLVLRAMKMEIEVTAPQAGRIVEVRVREGDAAGVGDLLATIDSGG